MIRSILLAGAALLSVSISPLNAEASGAPWCAVNPWGDGDVPWDCKYRSIEECRPVIAGNRGFCSPNPSYVANPPQLRNSRQASPMGSKTIAKSEKTIAVKKESPRLRNANARTKIVASPITVKTPRQHGKSHAESKNSIATKIETAQPARSDGKSNAESKNSIATKIETPQPAQSDGKSNAEPKNSIATKIETPQPAQPDDKSNAESKNSVATKIETPQPAQPDDKSNAESKNSIATKVETPQPAQPDDKSNAESKNSVATKIETPQPAQPDDKSNAESKNSVATKIETPQSSQLDDDTVIKKAKITVAAKMEDPASVEFVDIKRALNKNTYEIICGHIKGKRKSGEATGERPFLYLVKEDEAYIVDRGPDSMAAIVYRANCTRASSR
jgi:Protein of unknown function (DUF3551)